LAEKHFHGAATEGDLQAAGVPLMSGEIQTGFRASTEPRAKVKTYRVQINRKDPRNYLGLPVCTPDLIVIEIQADVDTTPEVKPLMEMDA
jgi:hypothetical protein